MCSERVGRERRERGSPTIYQKNGVRGVERYRALLYWESLDASAQRKYGVGCGGLVCFHSDCTIALSRAEKAGLEIFD